MRVIIKQKGPEFSLQVARVAQGMSQAELAEAAQISRAALSAAENGRPLQIKTAYKLAAALKRDFSELFDAVTAEG